MNKFFTFHMQKQITKTYVPCMYTVQRRSIGSPGKGATSIWKWMEYSAPRLGLIMTELLRIVSKEITMWNNQMPSFLLESSNDPVATYWSPIQWKFQFSDDHLRLCYFAFPPPPGGKGLKEGSSLVSIELEEWKYESLTHRNISINVNSKRSWPPMLSAVLDHVTGSPVAHG